jgi:hypothetical protein
MVGHEDARAMEKEAVTEAPRGWQVASLQLL